MTYLEASPQECSLRSMPLSMRAHKFFLPQFIMETGNNRNQFRHHFLSGFQSEQFCEDIAESSWKLSDVLESG